MSGKYFAYGSNMNIMRLQDRVGEVTIHGAAVCHNMRFEYSKPDVKLTQVFGNIVPEYLQRVFGVVFNLTEYQLGLLDYFEPGYRKVKLELIDMNGASLVANSYIFRETELIMKAYSLELKPSREYVNHILRGAGNFNLPADYIHERLNVL